MLSDEKDLRSCRHTRATEHYPFGSLYESDKRDWLCFLIGFGSFLMFLPVVWFSFTNYDDPGYIVHNPHVATGLSFKNLSWAVGSLHGGMSYWHPATWASHQLDCQIFGLRPGPHHVTSALLHSLSGVFLFLFLYRGTGRMARSAFVAALFCIHPLHVESVAWVAERKDVLSGLFWMACLYSYSVYAAKPSFKRYIIVLSLFLLSIMSKPSAVALPCTLLLVDYWPLNRFGQPGLLANEFYKKAPALLLEKLPFLLAAIGASVAAFRAQQELGAMASLERFCISDRIDNAILSYTLYILKTFWPQNLSAIYVHVGYWPFALVIVSGILLVTLSWWFFTLRTSYPFLIIGWLWFIGTLVPMIGLVQVGAQSMADRYTYISVIGLFVIFVWGGADLAVRLGISKGSLLATALLILLILGFTMQHQLLCWADGASLFSHAVEVTHNNWLAHHNYGLCLADQKRYRAADHQFADALEIVPENSLVNRSRGMMYLQAGAFSDAAGVLLKAFAGNPSDRETNLQLASIYAGCPEPALRNADMALQHAFIACGLEQDARSFHVLAAAFAEKGQFAIAMELEDYGCALATAEGQDLSPFEHALKLYRSSQPFRFPPCYLGRHNFKPIASISER